MTPLIERDGRVERAWQALQHARLLTLTGPGGSGKTRLAIELASRLDYAAWLELATLHDPRLLAEYAAAALGVSDRTSRPSLTHIIERYGKQRLLLVLDNCEHVVDAAASFVAQLLRGCPEIKVLATSREALGVAGERTVAVAPLSLPEDDSVEAAQAADATVLFVERARDVRPEFELSPRNAPAVARICRRLDGIPLALELAAARMRALDPEQLAERLESSLGLLETGSKAALPRHRTIRDTLDWSYKLLSGEERTLLDRLSVFTGTFSLDAVEAICADPADAPGTVLDLVTGLLDKSLLLYDPGETGTRYRLLETVREYAAEHLAAAGESDRVRERHARFFVALAERAAPAIFGGVGDEQWMARIDEEAANFREAHDWCEQQSGRLDLSLRLAVALHWYWFARGRFNEGRLRVGIALTFCEAVDPVLRGRALTVLGQLALWQGDHVNVHAPMEEAVVLLRQHGDATSLAYALLGVGVAAALQERLADARLVLEDAAVTLEAAPPAPLAGWIEYWRGLVLQWDHDPEAARHALESAIALGRRLGHKTIIAHSLSALGRLHAAAGRLDAAETTLREAFAIAREIEDRWGAAFAVQGLARTAVLSGQAERGAALLGAADLVREELGVDLHPPAKAYQAATTAEALSRIAEPAFWSAWAEGRRRPLLELVADAPAAGAQPAAAAPDVAAAPDLRVRTFGGFEVFVRGRRVEKSEWGSSRARELLAFLLCHPEGSTKSQIGLALWPDASPAQLRNTFHVTLHRLRHALALPDGVQVDGERYRLNPSLAAEFDARIFEREAGAALRELRRPSPGARGAPPGPRDTNGEGTVSALEAALALYRGDFLAGERVGEWVDEHRDRLRELHVEGLDALGRAQMERGRYAEAAEAFRALLAVDPVNEDACRRQMICLTELGDRAGALRAYDALARALQHELGVRPERETSSLRDRLVSAP
jgi:predicted ATPase/DNA-binding SARP family transcriptional activator